jgi:aspartyl/asparaginyl-tRNA synthetase
MADEQLEDTNLSSIIVNNLEKNDETNCQWCDTLKVDIQKAKQDILSYKEIIKILLEEQFITRQQQMNMEKMRLYFTISGAIMSLTDTCVAAVAR